MTTAQHYGLTFNQRLENDGMVYAASGLGPASGSLGTPALVVVSKPDIFDAHGKTTGWLALHGYRMDKEFAGFQLWRAP